MAGILNFGESAMRFRFAELAETETVIRLAIVGAIEDNNPQLLEFGTIMAKEFHIDITTELAGNVEEGTID